MTDVGLGKYVEEAEKTLNWKKRKEELEEKRKNGGSKVRGIGFSLIHRGEAFGAAGQGIDTA